MLRAGIRGQLVGKSRREVDGRRCLRVPGVGDDESQGFAGASVVGVGDVMEGKQRGMRVGNVHNVHLFNAA
jgi:hypothetical protein